MTIDVGYSEEGVDFRAAKNGMTKRDRLEVQDMEFNVSRMTHAAELVQLRLSSLKMLILARTLHW